MKNRKFLNSNWIIFILFCTCLIIFFRELIVNDLFISNATNNFGKIIQAAISPKINENIGKNILISYQNIFLFSSVGICFGIYLGILLNYFSTRFRKVQLGKYISIFLRAPHEVIFMFILMMIFGLNVYIAIFAIGLSFGGNLAKVFTDNSNLVEDSNFVIYKNRGFFYLNNFFFNLFPQAYNRNMDYIFYRYECAIRSTIVLSYIGIPGIGFYINMALGDSDFNSLFTYLYSLIIFVLFFGLFIQFAANRLNNKITLFIKLFIPFSIIISCVFLLNYNISFMALFQKQNWNSFVATVQSFCHILNLGGDFYTKEAMLRFLEYTGQTIVLGIVGLVFLMIFFNIFIIHFLYGFSKDRKISEGLNHLFSVIARSIPEVVFLTILLFFMKPNVVTGALALSLHNTGILLKLMKDRMISNFEETFTIYKKRGFGFLSLYCFLFLPLLKKDLINLTLYRFEMMIKSSVIIGILGSGGLGYLFRLEMSKFNYDSVFFIVIIYVFLFLLLDFLNKLLNKKLI